MRHLMGHPLRFPSTPCATLLAVAVLTAGFALLAGCESKPAAPEFNNPWDPAGPTGGDALNVRATASDTTIGVRWNQPQDMGIVSYLVSHALGTGPWEDLDEVAHTESDFGFYTYRNPEPTSTHWFRVQAFTEDGFSLVEETPAADVTSPPRVVPASGGRDRASRLVDLEITVTAGDSVRLADNEAFTDATTIGVVALGEPQTVTWNLGPGEDGDDFEVHVIVVDSGGVAAPPSASLAFRAAFDPRFTLAGNAETIARRTAVLSIPTTGVVSQRFALSEGDLAAAPWQDPATTASVPLADVASTQTVWGEFRGDFGYNSTHSIEVTPDLLTEAAFALDVPDDRIVDSPLVPVINDAVATLMRFSETPDFRDVAWRPYAADVVLTLSGEPGRKVVYAQFRNEWADSPILTDYVDLVAQPASIAFLAPGAGSILDGGTRLLVRGTATAGSGTARLDSVRFDPGDGDGWRQVFGGASWSVFWDVPAAAADSSVVLRARAWVTDTATSVVDSATATVSVIVAGTATP